MKLSNSKDAVVAVYASRGGEMISLATTGARALCFPVGDSKLVRAAGKGVLAIKLRPGDAVFAFELTEQRLLGAAVKTAQGREVIVRPSKFGGRRAGKGSVVLRRGGFVSWEQTASVSLLQIGEPEVDEEPDDEVGPNQDQTGVPPTNEEPERPIPIIYTDDEGEG
jgi:DNA gyrase/topoisomerase IV subunit A